MTIDKKILGANIKKIRVNQRMTMEEFAKTISSYSDFAVTPGKSNVSRWERGENIPNDITLDAIAKIGNVTVDELTNRKNTRKSNLQLLVDAVGLDRFIESTKHIERGLNQKEFVRFLLNMNRIADEVMEKHNIDSKNPELLIEGFLNSLYKLYYHNEDNRDDFPS
ncbi:MAG: helix-turn-helix transcriptional regulator [Aerococcaceae bacterium]|nr:helix-turn-helix transcriptional regulator [Aerococcaceae bacterium]